ncbi:hypothetical protein AQUCO_00100647v1 [Aquilegia coerulea]|uniref:Uncharacterized protein n=1 Tax=Aquilegia coerulea TaxID=218851 RepID=A0A2G5FBD0_AQUCA|nr:hypothetical protein AQUCO_00100647v1 [Aquilegia coerulea]
MPANVFQEVYRILYTRCYSPSYVHQGMKIIVQTRQQRTYIDKKAFFFFFFSIQKIEIHPLMISSKRTPQQ